LAPLIKTIQSLSLSSKFLVKNLSQ